MDILDNSWPKVPYGEGASEAAFMEFVKRILWKSDEYGYWISPPGTDDWYTCEEFLDKFSKWDSNYHFFFHSCKRKKAADVVMELLATFQTEQMALNAFMRKLQDYYKSI